MSRWYALLNENQITCWSLSRVSEILLQREMERRRGCQPGVTLWSLQVAALLYRRLREEFWRRKYYSLPMGVSFGCAKIYKTGPTWWMGLKKTSGFAKILSWCVSKSILPFGAFQFQILGDLHRHYPYQRKCVKTPRPKSNPATFRDQASLFKTHLKTWLVSNQLHQH